MTTTDAPEASTAESTQLCFDLFGRCIDKLDGADKTHFSNRHADFRLWADSVGAVAQGKASLDWRFHDRPSDIFLIKGLLSMIEGFLKACVSTIDNGDSVQEHLGKIDSMVENFLLIGVAIRRSGKKSRLQKADASFNRDRDKYLDLRAHLASVIVSKPTDGPRDLDKDTRSFDYFAKLELDPIQDRLVEANLRRRHRFMEAQRHSHLLKGPTTFDRPQGLILAAHILSSGSTQPTQEDSKKKEPKPGVARTASDTLTTPGTIASAPETGFKGIQQTGPAGSTVTRITAITARAQYPKAKAWNTDQLSFKCPCCCQAIPTREAEDSQFRKHLAYDLCPYTCILDNCPTPYKLFATEKEWNGHFMSAHPPRWQCPCCYGDPPIFTSLADIMTHIQTDHSDDVSDDELADVLSESVIHVMGITKCPLCDSDGPPDSPELVEHVLEHIHDFSLRSLPWPKDPVLNLNRPAGTFNVSLKDVDYITRWVDETSPEEECLPQLCALDHNPPTNTEERSLKESEKDYFAQNDYFLDGSSDSRFLSQSEQSSDVTGDTRSKASNPLSFYDSQFVSLAASRAGSDYLEGLYHSRTSPSGAVSPTDELSNDIGALDEVDVNSKDGDGQTPLPPDHRDPQYPIVGNAPDDLDLERLPAHQKKVEADWFAIFNPSVPRVLDVDLVHTLEHESYVCCVKFSHDSKYIATGCNRSAQIFDVATGQKICIFQHDSVNSVGDIYIRSVCFSPNGRYLATGAEDKLIRVWDIASRTIRNTFSGHEQDVYSLDFSCDGHTIASGSGDRTLRLWDIDADHNTLTLSIEDGVTTVAISPDSKYVAAGSLDKSVRVWDAASGFLVERLEGPDGHKDSIYSIAFAPNCKDLVSGSLDNTIKMWELVVPGGGHPGTGPKGGRCIKTFEGHKDFVLSVALTPDGNWVLSGSKDRGVQFWDPRTGNAQFMLQGHKNSVISVAASSTGGYFATGSGDMRARIWSYKNI